MSKPATPSSPTPAGDDRNLVRVDEHYVAPSFEDRLRLFWQRNSAAVTTVLIGVLLVIVAKGAWEYLSAQRELDVEQGYAAATTPAQLKVFVAAHPEHPLAGVAQVRLGDEAYAEGRLADAIAPYEQGAAVLKSGPLASRARLGAAMAKLQTDHVAEGEAALKVIASSTSEIKAYRAEAAYHLATYAAAKGQAADLKSYSDLLLQIDPASPFVQRVMQLRAATGGAAAPIATPSPSSDGPSIKLPAPGK